MTLKSFRRWLRSDKVLLQHVRDAAIAAQLPPPTDEQWLAKCAKVAAARKRLEPTPAKRY